ncbi:STAS domain-containing protein [Austwickia chelonae]|uniref:STAS domain-containing protein n=1 Tax=Austwickia chelonae TaxID=100225 RepID=UPI000E288F5D|nr:STAS domain-containing protein [Austwickia chelonae]
MADLEVATREEDGIAVVSVSGDVDVSNAVRLRDGLDKVLITGQSRLVVDLSDVPFMDSTGLGVLIGRLKVVRARRGSMRLVCAEPRMLRVLSITGLDTVFPMYATVAEAVGSFPAEDVS